MPLDCKQLKEKYEALLQEKQELVFELNKLQKNEVPVDFQRAKKNLTKIEKMMSEILELVRYPGSIYDYLKHVFKKSLTNIVGLRDMKFLPDGRLVGVLILSENLGDESLLFDGKGLVEVIEDRYIKSVLSMKVDRQGVCYGLMQDIRDEFCLFYGNKIVKEDINCRSHQDICFERDSSQESGKLFYFSLTDSGVTFDLPRDLDEMVTANIVSGTEVPKIGDFSLKSDGSLAAKVEPLGFLAIYQDGKIQKKIAGKNIASLKFLQVLPDGNTLAAYGTFIDKHGRHDGILKGETISTEIGGKKIRNVFNLFSLDDGTLAGYANLEGTRCFFVGEELTEYIEDKNLNNIKMLSMTGDGRFVGLVSQTDNFFGKYLPFIDDKILRDFNGEEIVDSDHISILDDGSVFMSLKIKHVQKDTGLETFETKLVVWDGKKFLSFD